MRHAARTDARHVEYVRTLEAFGWTVDQCHGAGHGWPDAIASRRIASGYHLVKDKPVYRTVTYLLEFKNGPKDKLTKAQEKFHERHNVVVIRDVTDCERLRCPPRRRSAHDEHAIHTADGSSVAGSRPRDSQVSDVAH